MAGTGMNNNANYHYQRPNTQGHQNGHHHQHGSYPVPPKREKMPRSKSEPDFDERHGKSGGRRVPSGAGRRDEYPAPPRKGKSKGRSSGGGRDRDRRDGYKSEGYKSDTADRRNNGYKSDSAARKKTSSRDKDDPVRKGRKGERSGKPTTRSKSRGKSESGREKENRKPVRSKSRGKSQERRTSAKDATKERARRRAKSAPARTQDRRPSRDSKHPSNFNTGKGDLPKEFYCPLTKRLMKDPVVDTEGNTYEREAIERWLRVQSSSPITNRYLSLDMLTPDAKLKKMIYKATGE